MNLYSIILLVVLVSIFPIYKMNNKEIKLNKPLVIILGIISAIINVLIIYFSFNMKNYLIHTIVISILAIIFNYFTIKGDININKIPKSFGVFIFFFFSVLFQLIPVYLFNYDIENITTSEQMILTTFADCMSFIILIIVYFKDLKEDLKKLKNKLFATLDTSFKYWILGLIVMVISNTIIILFFRQATAVNEEGVQQLIHTSSILAIISFGILAPVIEELTFRKAFRDVFKNDLAFILLSGLTFGALHVVLSYNSFWDFLYIIPYSSLGIAFAKAYQETNNIFSSIIMHMIHNTVLTLISIMGLGVILLW